MKNWVCALLLVFFASCRSNNTGNTKTEATHPVVNQEGKQLFYSKCASCHMVNKELTGPALKGVEDRWPDKRKLYSFIRNSQEMIKTDKYAHELWLKYNQTMMNLHPDMTDGQIKSLLDYIKSVSEEPKS